jgi:hypothetical protein
MLPCKSTFWVNNRYSILSFKVQALLLHRNTSPVNSLAELVLSSQVSASKEARRASLNVGIGHDDRKCHLDGLNGLSSATTHTKYPVAEW